MSGRELRALAHRRAVRRPDYAEGKVRGVMYRAVYAEELAKAQKEAAR